MTKFLKYLFLISLFVLPYFVNAQSFSISEIDASKFPEIKASFVTLDPTGKSYENLVKADFDVKENGVSMNPTVEVSCKDTAINPAVSVVLVLDQSTSMNELDTTNKRRWDWVLKGADSFLKTIQFGNGTKVAVVSFGQIAFKRCPFSDNYQELMDSINTIYVSGATKYDPPFVDYKVGAIEMLKTMPPTQRRIIVFLTDGEPNVQPSTDSIIRECQAANIQVYSITLTMAMNADLAKISAQTAGRSFAVFTEAELNSIYKLIAIDIQNKTFCTLKWIAPFGCSDNSKTRLTDITFLRLGNRSIRTYDAPPNSIAKVNLSDQVLFFGDPAPSTSTTADLVITPKSTALNVKSITSSPPTYFSVINWDVGGSGGPPPFTIDTGKSRTIRVQFTQGASLGYRTAQLLINGDPCDETISLVGGLNQVRILSPEGGEIFSTCDTVLIKWAGVDASKPVNLSYSTDGGKNWITIKNNVYGFSYRWNPPTAYSNYLIRAVVNTSKSYMWSKTIGGSGNDAASSITIQSDDLYGYVAGRFEGTVKFDKTVTSRGAQDGFLFKFDTDGNIIWSATMGGNGMDSVAGVVADGAGNPFVVGTCFGGAQFGTIMPTFPVDNASYCFIAKYPSVGGNPNVKLIGPDATYTSFRAWGIKIRYAPGNILVQGQYINQGKIDNYNLPKVTTPSFFTATYGDDLTLKYLQTGTVAANDYSSKSDTSASGNVFSCDSYVGNLASGTISITSNGDRDGFFRKYGGTPGSQDTINSPFEVISPQIGLKLTDLNIGRCTLGYSKDSIVTAILCNTGKKDVKINGSSISGNNPGDFTLTTNITGRIIKVGECITLEFNFNPKDVADRIAQLSIFGSCNEVATLNLQGFGVCSGLIEEKVAFGNVSIGMPQTKKLDCAIQNTNPTTIPINPTLIGPNFDEFSISPTGSAFLDKDSCYKLDVVFNPKTPGPKVAYIDYGLPSSCEAIKTELTGYSYDAKYKVEGYDWQEKRVKTINPYFIVLNNTSTMEVDVTKIEFDNPAMTQFVFGTLPNLPRKVNTGDTIRIPVSFNPNVEGDYLNFVNVYLGTLKDPMKAEIHGKGVLPKMNVSLDCGTTIKFGENKNIDLTIVNPSLSSNLKIDSMVITTSNSAFTWLAGQPINETVLLNNQKNYGLNFKPTKAGQNTANLRIYADDTTGPGPNFIKITNFTLSCDAEGITISPTFAFNGQILCSKTDKILKLSNNSSKSDLTIVSYKFETNNPDSSAFTVKLPNDKVIKAGSSADINITFNPIVIKSWKTKLYITLSNGEIAETELSGNSYIVSIESESFTPEGNPLKDGKELRLGDAFKMMIKGSIENLESGNINLLSIRLKYDVKKFEYIDNRGIAKFNDEVGGSWSFQKPVKIDDSTIEITGSGTLNTPFTKKNLFSLWFIPYLSETEEYKMFYNHYITNCDAPDTTNKDFTIAGVCFLKGRLIKLSDTEFYMKVPQPNPSNSTADVKFGIGYKSNTNIDIINAQGVTVLNAVNQILEAGIYDLSINVKDLPQGVYFIRFNSGGNTITEKLIKQ